MNEYFVNLNIKEMPETMRPREKLIAHGEDKLDEAELLAIVLGSGTREMNALELARQLLARHGGSLRFLMSATLEELTAEKGIGMAKAVSIKAAIEMGRRVVGNIQLRRIIKSPEDVQEAVRELAMEEMRHYDREHFRVLYLDRRAVLLPCRIYRSGVT